jgi:hypothetical protein
VSRAAPPSPHPLGPDAPTEDHVGLAFGALPVSIALGTGVASLTTFTVRTLQAAAPPAEALDLAGAPALVLLLGTMGAMGVAAAVTWRLLAPARAPFRQGALAMVSAFATLVVSLLTMPVDRALGRPGLLGLAALALAAGALGGRRVARRGGG